MSAAVIRPAATPAEYSSSPRCSTPGRPPGILVKSYCPARFWAVVKEQWSVATVSISPSRRAAHRASWSSCRRRGGAQTYLAASAYAGWS